MFVTDSNVQVQQLTDRSKFTSTNSFPPVEKIINVSRFLMVYFEDWPEGFNSSLSFVWISLSWGKTNVKYSAFYTQSYCCKHGTNNLFALYQITGST